MKLQLIGIAWLLPVVAVAATPLASLAGRGDVVVRQFQKEEDRRIRFEVLVSFAGDPKRLCARLEKVDGYRDWLLHKLNETNDGEMYPLRVLDLRSDRLDRSKFQLDFKLEMLLAAQVGTVPFRFRPETGVGICAHRWTAEPSAESPLESAEARFEVHRAKDAPGRVWIRWAGAFQLRSSLHYRRASVDRLERQSEERIWRAVENFRRAESGGATKSDH